MNAGARFSKFAFTASIWFGVPIKCALQRLFQFEAGGRIGMPRHFEESFRGTNRVGRFTGDFARQIERRLQWIVCNARYKPERLALRYRSERAR